MSDKSKYFSINDFVEKPKAGDRFEVSGDFLLEGGPCTGTILMSELNYIVLLRGDKRECRIFDYEELAVKSKWEKDGVQWWWFTSTGIKPPRHHSGG